MGKQGFLALAAVCVLAAGAAHGAVITFRSGDSDGAIGTADPNVRVLSGPHTTGFLSLTEADFAAARSANPARLAQRWVYEPYSWLLSLPSDPAARWINVSGTNRDYEPSGLYAIRIDNEHGYATNVTLDLYYAVDDYLGSRDGEEFNAPVLTAAVYLNGDPLTDRNGQTASWRGSWTNQERELHFTGLTLLPGENWIYINATNWNIYAGGVIFSGTLTIVPEPASLSLLAACGATLLSRRRR